VFWRFLVTLYRAATGGVVRSLDSTPMIGLTKLGIKFLPFDKLFHRLGEPTDAPTEKSIEREAKVDSIGWVAYMEHHYFLKAPTEFADIARVKKSKGNIVDEELCI
jgi:hypothetical protein